MYRAKYATSQTWVWEKNTTKMVSSSCPWVHLEYDIKPIPLVSDVEYHWLTIAASPTNDRWRLISENLRFWVKLYHWLVALPVPAICLPIEGQTPDRHCVRELGYDPSPDNKNTIPLEGSIPVQIACGILSFYPNQVSRTTLYQQVFCFLTNLAHLSRLSILRLACTACWNWVHLMKLHVLNIMESTQQTYSHFWKTYCPISTVSAMDMG